jgi:prepilin-type N-terminal cleavage/methylation domain-containing protein
MDNLRRNDFGFTFIEILIVIIISGMLIGLSTASAKEILLKGNTEKAVFEMYSDICALRNESIFTYKQSRVRFYMNYNNTNQSAYVLQFIVVRIPNLYFRNSCNNS